MEASNVAAFFTNSSVLVTGGTGFLGGVLVEKLLRACPDIANVYLLVRAKKGKSVEERVRQLLGTPLFSKLDALALKKVVVIEGDVCKHDLGLTPEDKALLISRVSVVFHSAAFIKFNATLFAAVNVNLVGTRRVVALCREMTALKVLVHVSTAYANCDQQGGVREAVYPTVHDHEYVMRLVEENPPEVVNRLADSLLGGHPNTYTFTKQLAESMVAAERGHVPVAIVRPSVVLGTYEEPLLGWADNIDGAFGFLAGAAKGVIRTMMADEKNVSDIVPCDYVANMTIAAAWDVATRAGSQLEVFHCCSGPTNPITWGQYVSYLNHSARKNPCEEFVWYPGAKCRPSWFRNGTAFLLFQLVPAYIISLFVKPKNQQQDLVAVAYKCYRGLSHISHFTMRQWDYDVDNAQRLAEAMNDHDRKVFPFDMRRVNWPQFFDYCVLGVREYFYKEYPQSLPWSRRLLLLYYCIHVLFHVALFVVCTYIFYVLLDTGHLNPIPAALSAMTVLFFVWL